MIKYQDIGVTSTFAAIIFRSYYPLYHSCFVRFPVLVGQNSHVHRFAQAPNDPIAIYPHLLSLLKTYQNKTGVSP